MADESGRPWALRPMVVTVTDKGETFQVADVQLWIDERKTLLRRARDILTAYDGTPVSLYKQYGKLLAIAGRLGSCPTGWCSFGGVAASISGQAGMVRRPWLAV